jgi:hypothetical protein
VVVKSRVFWDVTSCRLVMFTDISEERAPSSSGSSRNVGNYLQSTERTHSRRRTVPSLRCCTNLKYSQADVLYGGKLFWTVICTEIANSVSAWLLKKGLRTVYARTVLFKFFFLAHHRHNTKHVRLPLSQYKTCMRTSRYCKY